MKAAKTRIGTLLIVWIHKWAVAPYVTERWAAATMTACILA